MLETTCLGCSCLCDDLKISQDKDGQLSVDSKCEVAHKWVSDITNDVEPHSVIDGKNSDTQQAIEKVATLLSNSASPLVTGMKDCSSQTIREAIQLAERLGGYIDPLTSKSDSSRLKALNQHGASSCTLGEVVQRADLIIVWGDSVIGSNPCLLNRLELDKSTPFLPNGRKDRHLVSITKDSKVKNDWCNECICIAKKSSSEVLSELLFDITNSEAGLSLESEYVPLVEKILSAQYPVIIFDSQLGIGEEETAWNALAKLVAKTNQVNRLHTLSISSDHPSHMAESVLSWQTGYSRCLNFRDGTPNSNLDLWSTQQLLDKEQIDVCLFIGSKSDVFLKQQWTKSNSDMKLILITPEGHPDSIQKWNISIPSSQDGVHNAGTFLRFDHVPLPSRKVADSLLLSIADVLKQISSNV